MLKLKIHWAMLPAIICIFCIQTISAQNSDAPKLLSNTYFLQNCFVVKQPGTILPLQNVLIKDGVIADIGPVIKPPFDAQILKADSFMCMRDLSMHIPM